jgi:hypothetical protein
MLHLQLAHEKATTGQSLHQAEVKVVQLPSSRIVNGEV